MQLVNINVAALKIKSALSQVANESARKAIACSRGVEYILQQVTRHYE